MSSLEHFQSDPMNTLPEVALFFEKIHKIVKNKVQGCSTPLSKISIFQEIAKISHIHKNYDFFVNIVFFLDQLLLPYKFHFSTKGALSFPILPVVSR